MLVTIYTDASFNPESGQAAGAAWIRSEKGKITYKQEFEAENSTHAEGIAMLQAMECALEAWKETKVVFINTDSLSMCHFLWPFKQTTPKTEELIDVVNSINNLAQKYGVELRTKHVKGHQGNKNTRAWLNNWCDQQAGLVRKKAES